MGSAPRSRTGGCTDSDSARSSNTRAYAERRAPSGGVKGREVEWLRGKERVLAARVRSQALRSAEGQHPDRIGTGIAERMPDPDRLKGEVPLGQAMDVAVDLEEQLAFEDVERLLEGMEVALQPAAGLENRDREIGMDGALVGADKDLSREAVKVRGVGHRMVGEGPVDRCDVGGHLIPTLLNTDVIVTGQSSDRCGKPS